MVCLLFAAFTDSWLSCQAAIFVGLQDIGLDVRRSSLAEAVCEPVGRNFRLTYNNVYCYGEMPLLSVRNAQ